MMTIYLATPVNGRKEKSLDEKRRKAYQRILQMKEYLRPILGEVKFISSFDYAPLYSETLHGETNWTEAEIMGACVRMVMTSDLVILDSENSLNSKGMIVESYVARIYGIKVRTLKHYKMMEQLDGLNKFNG